MTFSNSESLLFVLVNAIKSSDVLRLDAFSSNAISKAIFGTYLDGYDDNPIALEGPLTDDAGADVTPEFSLTVTRDTNSVVAASGTGYQTFIGFTLDIESI